MQEEAEQIHLLREILKWTRFSGLQGVTNALTRNLDTEQKKLIYYLSDGEKGSVEISKAAGVSDWTVRNYWRLWARSGLVEAQKSGRGERFKHSFDVEDFGLEIPKIVSTENSQTTQAPVAALLDDATAEGNQK